MWIFLPLKQSKRNILRGKFEVKAYLSTVTNLKNLIKNSEDMTSHDPMRTFEMFEVSHHKDLKLI